MEAAKNGSYKHHMSNNRSRKASKNALFLRRIFLSFVQQPQIIQVSRYQYKSYIGFKMTRFLFSYTTT